jgi:hypothetical protein
LAKQILDNSIVTINGVNLSTYAHNGEWTLTRPSFDVSGMGAPYVEYILGKPDAQAAITLWQDYAAGTVDATLFPLASTDTPFAISWRIENAAISTSNPEYQMTVLLPEYQPVAGGTDAPAEVTATFLNASTTGLVRDVTP